MRELSIEEAGMAGGGLCKEFFDGSTMAAGVGGFVLGLSAGSSVGPVGALVGCAVGGTLGLIAPQLLKTVVCPE
jgi:hypothetical protein